MEVACKRIVAGTHGSLHLHEKNEVLASCTGQAADSVE